MHLLRLEEREAMLGYVEDLANTEDIERRAMAISLLDTLASEVELEDTLSDRDIQFLRSINIRLRDVIDMLVRKEKTKNTRELINHLTEVVNKLEQYINEYYQKYGELPEYTYGDHVYFRRRNTEYGYPYYRYYPYYYEHYPSKNKVEFKYVDKLTGNLELSEKTKDQLLASLSIPDTRKYIWDRPNETFESFMEYNMEQLKQKTEELKRERLNRDQQLSENKPDYEKVLEIFVNKWLQIESKKWKER